MTHAVSAKDRKRLLKEKRQKFEVFRLENKRLKQKFDELPDLTVDLINKQPSNAG